MKIVTSEVMREIDTKTIDGGFVEGKVLMKRAGDEASKEIVRYLSRIHENFKEKLVVLCGKGNNGGDGYVIAKDLHDRGFQVEVHSVCPIDELKGDALFHAENLPKAVPVLSLLKSSIFNSGYVLIDCLLGTGLKEALREPFHTIVDNINSSRLPVISVDIASGLNGTSGEVKSAAVVADLTIAIGLPKTGYFSESGPEHTGQLVCVDIGFPEEIISMFDGHGEMIDNKILEDLIVRRGHGFHKYRCGNVVVIGGSRRYMGAVALSASASARSGAGMVTCIHPDRAMPVSYKSIISIAVDSEGEGFAKSCVKDILDNISKADVIVIGPGMIDSVGAKTIFSELLSGNSRLVIDAGALGYVAWFEEKIKNYPAEIVLTPHSGELRRLAKSLGITGTDSELACIISSRLNVCLVLKGQFSKVYDIDGSFCINRSGSSTLATAGSGDVLAGIIGAFAAEFDYFYKSVCAAVYIHGLSVDYNDKGVRGTIADDLVESIPQVLQSLSPFA